MSLTSLHPQQPLLSLLHCMQPEMPRTKKRKIDHPVDDPAEYIRQYCERRQLSKHYGNSPLEKECQQLAHQAREDFKLRRDANTNPDTLDRKGLSPAEKYTIRLQNNRKSAEASKVYNEILKIEQAHRLANLPEARAILADARPHPSTRLVADLRKQVETLKRDNTRLNGALNYERDTSDKLRKQLHQLQQAHFQTQLRSQPMPIHPPLPQTQSQSQQNENPDSVPDSAPPSLHQRLVNSRGSALTWTLSPPADADLKDFHTGLTCSQSQPEEPDDKSLVRSLPLSSSIPLNLLGSQPSQDIPYKTSIGSEELPVPPESDFFMGSQGTSKGRPS